MSYDRYCLEYYLQRPYQIEILVVSGSVYSFQYEKHVIRYSLVYTMSEILCVSSWFASKNLDLRLKDFMVLRHFGQTVHQTSDVHSFVQYLAWAANSLWVWLGVLTLVEQQGKSGLKDAELDRLCKDVYLGKILSNIPIAGERTLTRYPHNQACRIFSCFVPYIRSAENHE